mgnify:CR=1 FL=1
MDNASTDGTTFTVNEFASFGIVKYFRLQENIGGSGGFSFGIKQAYEDGYDFIWGMDG